jgi:hypothetical protein
MVWEESDPSYRARMTKQEFSWLVTRCKKEGGTGKGIFDGVSQGVEVRWRRMLPAAIRFETICKPVIAFNFPVFSRYVS